MSTPEDDIDVAIETPVDDRLEQLAPVAPVLDDDRGVAVGLPDAGSLPVEADEADVVEQSREVPLDEEYPVDGV